MALNCRGQAGLLVLTMSSCILTSLRGLSFEYQTSALQERIASLKSTLISARSIQIASHLVGQSEDETWLMAARRLRATAYVSIFRGQFVAHILPMGGTRSNHSSLLDARVRLSIERESWSFLFVVYVSVMGMWALSGLCVHVRVWALGTILGIVHQFLRCE